MTIKKTAKTEEVKNKGYGMSYKKVVLIHSGLLLVLLAAAGFAYFKYWNVAVVNGKGVSRLAYIKTLESQGGKQVLEGMVQEAMITQEAKKKGVSVDKSFVDGELAKIDEQIKAQGQTLEAALVSQGMTKADLERQITLKKMVTEMSKPTTEITQAQVDKFITDNKAQLPPKGTKAELEQIAKEQLTLEASNNAITTWLAELKKNAQVIYK